MPYDSLRFHYTSFNFYDALKNLHRGTLRLKTTAHDRDWTERAEAQIRWNNNQNDNIHMPGYFYQSDCEATWVADTAEHDETREKSKYICSLNR